jgi:TonB family protein
MLGKAFLVKATHLLSAQGAILSVGLVMLGGAGLAIRWVVATQEQRPMRKVRELHVVQLQRPKPTVPKVIPKLRPRPEISQKLERERVQINKVEIPPPDAPPPSSQPAAGPLSLDAEGEGPGDAFNLVGNPGGRGLLSGGGLGDGAGGIGGGYDPNSRYGWYYARLASDIEEVLRQNRHLRTASLRVELRVWANGTGRISQVRLVRSTGDRRLDRTIRSAVEGLPLSEPLPADIPMPVVLRLTARRPA